jgi:putative transposase
MVHYRRNRVPGGTYFFIVTVRNRRATFLIQDIYQLRSAIRHALRPRPFSIDAMVVLPDHLHTVWTLPDGMPGVDGC